MDGTYCLPPPAKKSVRSFKQTDQFDEEIHGVPVPGEFQWYTVLFMEVFCGRNSGVFPGVI